MKTLDLNAMENIQGGATLPGGLPGAGAILAIVFGLVNAVVASGVGALTALESALTQLAGSLSGLSGSLGGL